MDCGSLHFSALLLSEDGAKNSFETILYVTKKSLQTISPGLPTHRLEFLPIAPSIAKKSVYGNAWKEKKAHGKQVELAKAIATHMARPDGVVVYHMDADRPWPRGSSTPPTSENIEKFERLIVPKVQIALDSCHSSSKLDSEKVLHERLFLMIPYYSIEAWLFTNLDEVRQLQAQRADDLHVLDNWECDPRSIEELKKPKESLSCGAQHNESLACRFHPGICSERSSSYSLFIDGLLNSSFLGERLRSITMSQFPP